MIRLKLTKELLFTTVLLFTACGGGSNNTIIDNNSSIEENIKPRVDAGEDRKAQINTPIIVWGSAEDPDGVISSYEWKKGGEILSTTAKLSYTPTILGIDKIILTVMDNEGATASDSLNIEIVTQEVEDRYNEPLPF